MTIPVLVTVPSTRWDKSVFGGDVKMPEAPDFRDSVVGIIAGCDAHDVASKDKIERALGLEIGILVRRMKCAEGKIAIAIAPAVRCDTIEQAMALPGFTHLFLFPGVEDTIPPALPITCMPQVAP